ncbi:enoyl-CoA hydratase/isomerase family protein [Corynebacterium sp. TAE3-ERU12]|uniref:3-hydroxyacyl-CoA dehydrogenase NAD-binding domain-containing protein n=1 Tax=Corynebacterium sp. TAE3-ERU12 TaxID=2849491 RepID=UPI001C473A47|nr:3-hydroxyacyl-CoA dehydrogenase NAD-binding domain-containing protein [Corynebacterium sp. TAE3-ERU12]MBV7296040.1 enoyl-CoA hydratase/isomerase family protein [Corynebacterium sp. TAE3-ERU12]
MTDNMFRWDKDADNVVTLTMDDPNAPVNTMNQTFQADIAATADRLEAELADDANSIRGIIITSAKKTFFAGGDIVQMSKATKDDAAEMFANVQSMKDSLRRIEKLPVPVVAAINGAALGGGLEVALAANYRIAADVRGSKIGLPEVTLGLLPGGGGISRVTRMIGLQDALMKVILTGAQMNPGKAHKVGVVDEVVSADELLQRAHDWVTSDDAVAQQPWDVKGFRFPGGTPSNPKLAMNLPSFPANLTKQLKGAPMLAPRRAMQAAIEGAQVDIDTALTIESRYFTELVTGTQSKNMMQAFFFDLNHCNGGGSRPTQQDGTPFPKTEFKKVGVVGAGMMGAGIAYVCAKAGMEVVLKDISMENAERGKAYSEGLEKKALERGRTTEEKSKALLDRIKPTDSYDDLSDIDLVVEAVFENTDLKHKVHAEIEAAVPKDCVLGSNTSTLPITELGSHVERTGDFIGLHFFSPVDKMKLIEIISGDDTDPATLAKALDFSVAIRKIPIVVNDSRGFYTSRVIGTVINEALRMVVEGYDPAIIEAAGRQAGYPAPQLQLADELNLKLMEKIANETRAAFEAEGKTLDEGGVPGLVDAMINKYERPGRLEGQGFYNYADGKRAGLWDGLWSELGAGSIAPEDTDLQDLMDRMLFIEAIETQKCFDEGVIEESADANIGSIFGIGYPAWTGGTKQFIENYDRFSGRPVAAKHAGVAADGTLDGKPTRGVAGFVARAEELAAKYGERFEVPASLK